MFHDENIYLMICYIFCSGLSSMSIPAFDELLEEDDDDGDEDYQPEEYVSEEEDGPDAGELDDGDDDWLPEEDEQPGGEMF